MIFGRPFVCLDVFSSKNGLTVALFNSKFYFCIEFGCEMTEDQKRLLAVFEVRVRDLMELCNKQNHTN